MLWHTSLKLLTFRLQQNKSVTLLLASALHANCQRKLKSKFWSSFVCTLIVSSACKSTRDRSMAKSEALRDELAD